MAMIMKWEEYLAMATKMTEEGYIPVFGPFETELEEIVVGCIFLAKSKGQKEITFLINSNGGKSDCFTAIKSAMIISKINFTGFVMSRARSNGFRLLQHCHKRVAVRNAELLFHWGHNPIGNSEIAALINGDKWVIEHIVTSSKATAQEVHERTGIPLKTLYQYALYERPFTAEEALDLKMLDEIVEDFPLSVKKALIDKEKLLEKALEAASEKLE